MEPTNKLRFVLREEWLELDANVVKAHKSKILQQWWCMTVVDENTYREIGEWRDVPVECEGD